MPVSKENPSIAFIVPTLNEESVLRATLERIQEQTGPSEIIVADGGSSDATIEIAKSFSSRVSQSESGRGLQMNAGASLAKSSLLCFVHADTFLPMNAANVIREHLSSPSIAAGSFRLSFDTQSKRLDFYSYCSRINHALFTYGDQALFLRRETFEKTGGFKKYPFLEDIEIQKRLRKLGKFVKAKDSVITSARRFRSKGTFIQQLLNLAIVSGYLIGISPQSLKKFYVHIR